jgi:transcriptional regulator with XRE-family HTH domain
MFDYLEMKRRRIALSLSVAEATERAGWHREKYTYWHNLEAGRRTNPTVQTLCQVALALRCKITDLVTS